MSPSPRQPPPPTCRQTARTTTCNDAVALLPWEGSHASNYLQIALSITQPASAGLQRRYHLRIGTAALSSKSGGMTPVTLLIALTRPQLYGKRPYAGLP